MAAIAGVSNPKKEVILNSILMRLKHRGKKTKIFSTPYSILGIAFNSENNSIQEILRNKREVIDEVLADEHYAKAEENNGKIELSRDFVGVVPLYFGFDAENNFCFASEVKGLVGIVKEIRPVPPGGIVVNGKLKKQLKIFKKLDYFTEDISQIKNKLYSLIENSIRKCIPDNKPIGVLLSGGLDSSTIAVFARKFSNKIYGFSCGLSGASDLEYGKMIAKDLGIIYYPIKTEINELIKILPEVIYHLESFDARLVRSSLMHYLTVSRAADYTDIILSGEGGDELFAGYNYLQKLTYKELENELPQLFYNLHNTALQRVDRCSAAFGVKTFVPFLCKELVSYAKNIKPQLKIRNNSGKWILRETLKSTLPDFIINRQKEKLWQGSGLENKLENYINKIIKDDEFRKNCILKNGWKINSKEEYYYYKIFQEFYSSFNDYNWIGRTDISKP